MFVLILATIPAAWAQVDGETVVRGKCTACHSSERIRDARKTTTEWATTVDREIARGAQLNNEERDAAVQWLAANYSSSPSASNATAQTNPTGGDTTATLPFNQQARTGIELWQYLLTGSSLLGSGIFLRFRRH